MTRHSKTNWKKGTMSVDGEEIPRNELIPMTHEWYQAISDASKKDLETMLYTALRMSNRYANIIRHIEDRLAEIEKEEKKGN